MTTNISNLVDTLKKEYTRNKEELKLTYISMVSNLFALSPLCPKVLHKPPTNVYIKCTDGLVSVPITNNIKRSVILRKWYDDIKEKFDKKENEIRFEIFNINFTKSNTYDFITYLENTDKCDITSPECKLLCCLFEVDIDKLENETQTLVNMVINQCVNTKTINMTINRNASEKYLPDSEGGFRHVVLHTAEIIDGWNAHTKETIKLMSRLSVLYGITTDLLMKDVYNYCTTLLENNTELKQKKFEGTVIVYDKNFKYSYKIKKIHFGKDGIVYYFDKSSCNTEFNVEQEITFVDTPTVNKYEFQRID